MAKSSWLRRLSHLIVKAQEKVHIAVRAPAHKKKSQPCVCDHCSFPVLQLCPHPIDEQMLLNCQVKSTYDHAYSLSSFPTRFQEWPGWLLSSLLSSHNVFETSHNNYATHVHLQQQEKHHPCVTFSGQVSVITAALATVSHSRDAESSTRSTTTLAGVSLNGSYDACLA